MGTIFLVRHGESEQNARILSNEYKPDHAIELTITGQMQARQAGIFLSKYLKENSIDTESIRLWVSPFKRTRQTAELLNILLGIQDIKEDDMLTELQFGIFHNIPKEKLSELFPEEYKRYQYDRKYNGKYYARRPFGESPFDCEIRQKLFIDTIFRDFNNPKNKQNLIIVGHGAAINIFRKAFFHYSHEWYEKEPNPGNCSIQRIDVNTSGNIDVGYIYGSPMEERP